MDNKSMMQLDGDLDTQFDDLVNYCMLSGKISQHLYEEYDVKRGLRDSNGKGVLTGLTEMSFRISTTRTAIKFRGRENFTIRDMMWKTL